MIYNKVRTTRKTGNNVRHFTISVLLAVLVISCQKIDTGNDDPRDILVGVWYCNETSNSGTANYQVSIAKSTIDTTRILIGNFYLLGSDIDVYAKVNGLNLTIPSQTASGYKISGSGTISSNYKTINWTYTAVGTETDHVTAVYSK